jgi:MinD-like ATPase involved in chromosome partitioning or flagellar assembly
MEPAEDRNRVGDEFVPLIPGPIIPAFRLAVGLGDPERERALLPALSEGGALVVVERCLSADQLVGVLPTCQIDLALVADDLHRLSDDALAALAHTRVPLVVLAARPNDPRWQTGHATVLPLDAPPDVVLGALLAAWHGERPRPTPPSVDVSERLVSDTKESQRTEVATIAVASGHGSPGRTLVAVNLAVALGAVAPTILVDADVQGPSVAAYLDLDPTRNLFMLGHTDPRTPREWERTIAQETQPLGPRSPQGIALGGVPKPEMRAGISARFFESLLAELRQRYRYVVLDVGADLLGQEVVLHRLALGASDQILFVGGADLIGLWHARVGLGVLDRTLGVPADRVALVINRHDRRFHHRRAEIEWALGRPTAVVIPEDPAHVQKAVLAQRPLVLDRRSLATRQVLDLAGRVHGGTIVLPPEPARKGRLGVLGHISLPHFRSPFPRRRGVTTGRFDESDVAATS